MFKRGFYLTSLLMMASTSAHAGNYWQVQYNNATLGEDAAETTFGMMDFTYGWSFHKNLSAEANMIWSAVNRSLLPEDDGVNVDSGVGASLRAHVNLIPKLEAYTTVSYNIIHIHAEEANDLSDKGIGYGAGMAYELPYGSVFAEFSSILDNEVDKSDPLNLDENIENLSAAGIGFRFDMSF